MTVDYTDTAVGKIRAFLWDQLKANSIVDSFNYIADGFTTPLVPIIPVQQVPEFNNLIGNKPYIIYDYDINSYDDQWFICNEKIILTVVSSSFEEIIKITQFIIDLFRRMDETAVDINAWQGGDTKFKFFSFVLANASSPGPYEEEGGRQMAEIEIDYKYSRYLDENGRFQ